MRLAITPWFALARYQMLDLVYTRKATAFFVELQRIMDHGLIETNHMGELIEGMDEQIKKVTY
jgi:hypothetical protein